jgi:hypothetical protein
MNPTRVPATPAHGKPGHGKTVGVQPNERPSRPLYMRTGRVLVAAGFVLLTAAACGSQGGSASAGAGGTSPSVTLGATATTATAPPSTVTSPVTPPSGVITGSPVTPPGAGKPPTVLPVPNEPKSAVPPGQISSGGMANPPQGVQVTSDGRYLVFNAEQSGCQQITAQTAAQTTSLVTVEVVDTNTSKGGQVCPMIVREVQVVAHLDAPLKARKIVFQGVTKHG